MSRPCTVLLLEDQDELRALLSEVLLSAGYNVLTATNGAQAAELCEANMGQVNALVCDLHTPGMPTTEFVQTAVRMNPSVRVVLMSGYPADWAKLDIPCAHEFLYKPFSTNKLLSVLGRPTP